MDEKAKLFCEKNPTVEIPCDNDACDYVFTMQSGDFIAKESHWLECPACMGTTKCNSQSLIDSFIADLKISGDTIR